MDCAYSCIFNSTVLSFFFLRVNSNFTWIYCLSLFTHCSRIKKILKIDPTILFTQLKIILLQYFQFLVFNFNNNKLNQNVPFKTSNTENSRRRKQPINNHSKEKLKSNATNQDKKAHWLRQKRNDNITFGTKTKDMTPPLKKIWAIRPITFNSHQCRWELCY